MEKSNEKTSFWKKVGLGIAGIFGAMFAFFLCGRRNSSDKAKRAEQVRTNLDTAKAANRDAEDRVEHATELNNNIERCTDECLDIIRDVRERSKKG